MKLGWRLESSFTITEEQTAEFETIALWRTLLAELHGESRQPTPLAEHRDLRPVTHTPAVRAQIVCHLTGK